MVDGVTLHFKLAAINNQNFVMTDVETGTWWQQVTGEALQGPLAGKRLSMMRFEEVSFGIWSAEHPGGSVMLPDADFVAKYAGADWERDMAAFDVPESLLPPGELEPRALVVGVQLAGHAVAYPLERVRESSPIADRVGAREVLVAVAADGKSVRVFDRSVGERVLDLYAKPDVEPPVFLDMQTGSEWSFSGRAVAGELMGKQLEALPAFQDYWFDWHNQYPATRVFSAGQLPARTPKP